MHPPYLRTLTVALATQLLGSRIPLVIPANPSADIRGKLLPRLNDSSTRVPVIVSLEQNPSLDYDKVKQMLNEKDEDFPIHNHRDEPAEQQETGIRHGKRAFNDNRLALVAVAKVKRVTKSRKANKLAAKQRKANRK